MRFKKLAVLALLALSLTACRSRYIAATITNQADSPLSVIQVDYPSASFGVETLAPHADFHYRFKIQGNGQLKLTWLTPQHKELHSTGPDLHEGEEGRLFIRISSSDKPDWKLALTPLNK